MSDDIVREFLVESSENLDLLDRELINLEKYPGNRSTLASIFRTIHTIKGTCGFLGFTKLESVAHVGENLLSKLRDGELALNPEMTTALLAMVDAIRQMLASVEAIGNEGERNDQELIQTLTRLLQGTAAAPKAEAKTEPKTETPGRHPLPQKRPAEPVAPAPAGRFRRLCPPVELLPAVASGADCRSGAENRSQARPRRSRRRSRPGGAQCRLGGTIAIPHRRQRKLHPRGRQTAPRQADERIWSSELVLARNQILQFSNATEDAGLLAPSQRLNLITTELQEGVMKTRMQPIGNIWSKFPRTVRDVATACGKQIRIEMEGKETELDKTIVEAIKDPLTHIVRNSVDHGIEKPERRVAVGKPAEGRLLLRAYHEGGQVIIEISDDGGGLDGDRIRRKAVEKGLITPEQAARMGERVGRASA